SRGKSGRSAGGRRRRPGRPVPGAGTQGKICSMTLTLELTPELERRLVREAAKKGVAAEEYTLDLLRQHLPVEDRRAKAIALLRSWAEQGDADEQRETGEYLIRALDEDRLSDRKLFPPDLKGVTW